MRPHGLSHETLRTSDLQIIQRVFDWCQRTPSRSAMRHRGQNLIRYILKNDLWLPSSQEGLSELPGFWSGGLRSSPLVLCRLGIPPDLTQPNRESE